MTSLTDRVSLTAGRHFVTLSCVQRPKDSPPKALVFSGFVAEVLSQWVYVTAGHVLELVETALNAGSTFDCWRLGDQTAAGDKFKGTAVPFHFDLADWVVIHDADLGIDYAAMPLTGLTRRQLEAGGVESIGDDAWGYHVGDHDHWVVVGIPSETVVHDGKNSFTGKFVMVPLEPTDAPEIAAADRSPNQFYAKLAAGSERFVQDMDGMSGAPIIGLKQLEGEWKYNVIGVQSAWYPTVRVVAACPFTSFAEALKSMKLEE